MSLQLVTAHRLRPSPPPARLRLSSFPTRSRALTPSLVCFLPPLSSLSLPPQPRPLAGDRRLRRRPSDPPRRLDASAPRRPGLGLGPASIPRSNAARGYVPFSSGHSSSAMPSRRSRAVLLSQQPDVPPPPFSVSLPASSSAAGASQTVRNKYKDTPIDLLSPTKPEDQEVREVLLEEKGTDELFDQGDLVGEDDLAGRSPSSPRLGLFSSFLPPCPVADTTSLLVVRPTDGSGSESD